TPPPPRFDEKVRVIRERQGQPLTTREIVDMGAKDFKSNRRIQIRPATETKAELKARGGEQSGKAAQPQPIAPLKGRNLATQENPVQTDIPRRQQRDERREDRQTQQQQQKSQEQQQRDLQKQQQEQKQQQRDQDQLQKKQERDQDQLQKK